MSRAIITAALVAFAGSALAPTSQASDAKSMKRLQAMVDRANALGFTCHDQAYGEYLTEGEEYTYETPFPLTAGTSYAVMGAGDRRVRDLDIEIYDDRMKLIEQDTATDDVPVVELIAKRTATYYVKVKMYEGRGYSNFAICYQ